MSDTLANASSFAVLNNKMYSAGNGNGLWETDGTEQGTKKLLAGVVAYPPFILNNTVFFSYFGVGTGYELWSFKPAGSTGVVESQMNKMALAIYPNPSDGHFVFSMENIPASNATVEIYNMAGERVYTACITKQESEMDLSGFSKGMYFVRIDDGARVHSRKIVVD